MAQLTLMLDPPAPPRRLVEEFEPGSLDRANDTTLVIGGTTLGNPARIELLGSGFGFNATGLLGGGGTVTAATLTVNGARVYEVTGISVSRGTLQSLLEGDGSEFEAEVFHGSDLFLLSNLADTQNGFGGSDTMRGFGGNDTLSGGDGADSLFGGQGSDLLNGGQGPDWLHGGEDSDTAVLSGSLEQYRLHVAGERLLALGPDGADVLTSIEFVTFSGSGTTLATSALVVQAATPLPGFAQTSLPDRQAGTVAATPYAGPVEGLALQYLGTAGGEAVGGTAFGDFLNALGGDDAVNGGDGNDVLDGGTGSNFLTGGAGADVFFLDGRSGEPTWSTIADWQAGEQLSVWGWRPGVSRALWVDSDGAAGFQGATLHADLDGDGGIDTSVTWAGLSRASLPAPLEFDGLLWFR